MNNTIASYNNNLTFKKSTKQIKSTLYPILIALRITGVDLIDEKIKIKRTNIIQMKIMNIFILLSLILLILSMVTLILISILHFSMAIFSQLLGSMFNAFLRMFLFLKKTQQKKLLKSIYLLTYDFNCGYLKKIKTRSIALLIIFVAFSLIYLTIYIMQTFGIYPFISNARLHNFVSMLWFLRTIYLLYEFLFMSVFFLYYSTLCWILKKQFDGLRYSLMLNNSSVWHANKYKHIADIVFLMDKTLNFGIFLGVSSSLSTIFMSIVTQFARNGRYTALKWVSSIDSFIRVFFCLYAAISLTEAGELCGKVLIKNQNSRLKQKYANRIKSSTPSLTIWKIYKIDRSLVVSLIGSLISFSVMFATLDSTYNRLEMMQ